MHGGRVTLPLGAQLHTQILRSTPTVLSLIMPRHVRVSQTYTYTDLITVLNTLDFVFKQKVIWYEQKVVHR